MPRLYNRAKMTTATTGTGTITLGSASTAYQSFSAAGVSNGEVVRYLIEDGSAWEYGTGTYTSAGTTLSRTPIESTNADAAINLSGSATVAIVAGAEDHRGKQAIWIPAGAMVARTTNGAASGTAETTTNKVMLSTLDFDATTAEYAQFSVYLPSSYNSSTFTYRVSWSHASTTVNFGVAWRLAARAFGDDDAMDAAMGTAVTVTDTGGTTDDQYVTSESTAVTAAGTPAPNKLFIFEVSRNPANASDNMAVDARLHGVLLFVTTIQAIED